MFIEHEGFCEKRSTHDASAYSWIKESYEATYGMRVKCPRTFGSTFYHAVTKSYKAEFLCRERTSSQRGIIGIFWCILFL